MSLLKLTKYSLSIVSISVPFLAFFFPSLTNTLWSLALYAVFILMIIRPLNDLFPKLSIIKLISLRKNLGIFSATIIVTFGILHYITLGTSFFSTYFSLAYWNFSGNLFWAHLGELTGAILLLTSNKFSMIKLKRNWKRIQRLSYIYFFSGSWYVFSVFHKTFGIVAIIIVFELTVFAFIKKRLDKRVNEIAQQQNQIPQVNGTNY